VKRSPAGEESCLGMKALRCLLRFVFAARFAAMMRLFILYVKLNSLTAVSRLRRKSRSEHVQTWYAEHRVRSMLSSECVYVFCYGVW